MMHGVYNKDHIHHLLNEYKIWIFVYICDRMVYFLYIVPFVCC